MTRTLKMPTRYGHDFASSSAQLTTRIHSPGIESWLQHESGPGIADVTDQQSIDLTCQPSASMSVAGANFPRDNNLSRHPMGYMETVQCDD